MENPLAGAAAQYAALKYGGPVSHAVDVDSIGTTPVNLLPGDADRLSIVLVNMSTSIMYVGYDGNVGSSRGVFLAANGGSLVSQVDEDLTLVTLPLWVVAASPSSDLFSVIIRRFAGLAPKR
jgi:hypothetical protein